MKLFELQNDEPIITVECLLIPEFKAIWDRDKSKTKIQAHKELTFVYFNTDYKSLYLSFSDKDEQLAKDFMGDEKWKPDKLITQACEKYDKLQQTPTMNFLKAARAAQKATESYFASVDYTERDSRGNAVYKGTEVTKMLKDCAGIKEALDKLEEAVKREQATELAARGDSTGGMFEMDED